MGTKEAMKKLYAIWDRHCGAICEKYNELHPRGETAVKDMGYRVGLRLAGIGYKKEVIAGVLVAKLSQLIDKNRITPVKNEILERIFSENGKNALSKIDAQAKRQWRLRTSRPKSDDVYSPDYGNVAFDSDFIDDQETEMQKMGMQ